MPFRGPYTVYDINPETFEVEIIKHCLDEETAIRYHIGLSLETSGYTKRFFELAKEMAEADGIEEPGVWNDAWDDYLKVIVGEYLPRTNDKIPAFSLKPRLGPPIPLNKNCGNTSCTWHRGAYSDDPWLGELCGRKLGDNAASKCEKWSAFSPCAMHANMGQLCGTERCHHHRLGTYKQPYCGGYKVKGCYSWTSPTTTQSYDEYRKQMSSWWAGL